MKAILIGVLSLFVILFVITGIVVIPHSVVLGIIGFALALVLSVADILCIGCDVIIVREEDFVK